MSREYSIKKETAPHCGKLKIRSLDCQTLFVGPTGRELTGDDVLRKEHASDVHEVASQIVPGSP